MIITLALDSFITFFLYPLLFYSHMENFSHLNDRRKYRSAPNDYCMVKIERKIGICFSKIRAFRNNINKYENDYSKFRYKSY